MGWIETLTKEAFIAAIREAVKPDMERLEGKIDKLEAQTEALLDKFTKYFGITTGRKHPSLLYDLWLLSARSKAKPAFRKIHSRTSQGTGVMRGDIGDFLQILKEGIKEYQCVLHKEGCPAPDPSPG